MAKKKNWIGKAVKNMKKGALTEKAKASGHYHDGKIDKSWIKSQASGTGQTAKQARFAMILTGMNRQ